MPTILQRFQDPEAFYQYLSERTCANALDECFVLKSSVELRDGRVAAGGIYYPKILFVQVEYPRRLFHDARGEDVISNSRKVLDGFLPSRRTVGEIGKGESSRRIRPGNTAICRCGQR